MNKIILVFLMMFMSMAQAQTPLTQRIPQFDNDQVAVWETIVYPSQQHVLVMHRHDRNRVLVALSNGTLKITNDKNQVHYLKLIKDHAYFLTKDIPGEMH